MMFMMQSLSQTQPLPIYLLIVLLISLLISGISLSLDILNANDCRLLYNLIQSQNLTQAKLVSYQCHHQSLEISYTSKQNQILRQTIKLIDANTYPPKYEIKTHLP